MSRQIVESKTRLDSISRDEDGCVWIQHSRVSSWLNNLLLTFPLVLGWGSSGRVGIGPGMALTY
jgi:hypothetical protein